MEISHLLFAHIEGLANNLGCHVSSLLLKYLGSPLEIYLGFYARMYTKEVGWLKEMYAI